jgi:ABC-type sugar transport system ATPase subunit
MTDEQPILDVKSISKSFLGVKALDSVNLTIFKGEIHAVAGENGAGKSTLMNIILGDMSRDSGEIIYDGRPVHFKSPMEAINAGISMIHQEISLVPTMSVAENIWLNREKRFESFGCISHRKRNAVSRNLLKNRIGIEIDPEALVSTLSVAQMQLVELARAISSNARIIIMDEPSSALSEREVQILFGIIRELSDQNVAVIFITHKLEEIFEICTKISVFRDGHYIGTKVCSETTHDELINMIIGREMKEQFPTFNSEKGDVALRISDFCGKNNRFENINFDIRQGEILGMAGLVGAGRSEIARAIFGIDRPAGGSVEINGMFVTINSPEDAVRNGIGMVTEDRLRLGIIPESSVERNISIATLKKFSNRIGLINKKKEHNSCQQIIQDLRIKITDIHQPISSLSGGNQQKSILARWMLTNPKILILDEPTRGIDIGAKSELYALMRKMAQQGIAILMISSELPEIFGLCDRILVIRDGHLVFMCNKENATPELIGKYFLA